MVNDPNGSAVHVEVSGTPTTPIVRVSGELDLAGADTVRTELETAVTAGAEGVELELGDLDFLDSSGLSVFIELAARLPVSITSASNPVRRIITVTGLDDVLGLPT